MKQSSTLFKLKAFCFLCFFSFFNLLVWAQDSTNGGDKTTTTTTEKTNVSLTTNSGAGQWYTSPWVWIAGAAVFILLLVALLSNRGKDTRTDRVTVKKTVERD
jgi:hypothetical protein